MIVEGVETEGQLTALQTTGAHRAQGYYLGRPLPEDLADDALAHANAAERIESTGDICVGTEAGEHQDRDLRKAV